MYFREPDWSLSLVFMNEFSRLGTALDSVVVVIHSEFTGRKEGLDFWLKRPRPLFVQSKKSAQVRVYSSIPTVISKNMFARVV